MRKFIIKLIIIILIGIVGYNIFLPEKYEVHPFNLKYTRIINIAHAAGKGLGPENTLFTLQKSVEAGADILEIDIHSTSDSILVLMHDHKVNRTTNGDGFVWDYTYEKLRKLNAGYYWTNDDSLTFPFREMGISIATLNDVFVQFSDTRINIEIKQVTPPIIENLCNMIHEYKLVNHVLIGSFVDGVLENFREECSDVATSAGMGETRIYYGLNLFHLDWLYKPDAHVFEVPTYFKGTYLLTNQFISGLQKNNIPIYVWTVNEKEAMRKLINIGIDGILTDFPDRLSEIIN